MQICQVNAVVRKVFDVLVGREKVGEAITIATDSPGITDSFTIESRNAAAFGKVKRGAKVTATIALTPE